MSDKSNGADPALELLDRLVRTVALFAGGAMVVGLAILTVTAGTDFACGVRGDYAAGHEPHLVRHSRGHRFAIGANMFLCRWCTGGIKCASFNSLA